MRIDMKVLWICLSLGVVSGIKSEVTQIRSAPMMTFQHSVVLDDKGDFVMLWTPEKHHINIEVQVATLGYIGLGFSPNGGMNGADMILGWVDAYHKVHLSDRYALGQTTPILDDSQDVSLMGGYQNDTHTVLRFSRPWNTCDTKHDFILTNDTIRVIWCYGIKDPIDNTSIDYHDYRGTKSMYLMEPRFTPMPINSHHHFFDIRAPNVHVPENLDTVYWCSMFKLPTLQHKTHMIAYHPLIKPENVPFLHHILVWECDEWAGIHLEKWLGHDGAQCFTPNMPPSWNSCTTPLLVWNVGSEGETYPDDIGAPLTDGNGKSKYLMMEIHYNNPTLKQDIIDNSGIRIIYTDKVRGNELGVWVVGSEVSPYMLIPPHQEWTTVGHCTSHCTQELIPPSGIKVFQAILHAHVIGKTLKLRHIRKGQELPTQIQDMNYDFNYQQTRNVQEMTIFPGDSIIVECGYNSSQKHYPTFGGFATSDEMCQVIILYYPKRNNIRFCYSHPDPLSLYKALGIKEIYPSDNDSTKSTIVDLEREREMAEALLERQEHQQPWPKDDPARFFKNIIIKSPLNLKNTSVYNVLQNMTTWRDERLVAKLQEQIAYGPYRATCNFQFSKDPQKNAPFKYPSFIKYQAKEDQCRSTNLYSIPSKGTALKIVTSNQHLLILLLLLLLI